MTSSQTSQSLLSELRHEPADSDSWERFVDLYQPKITRWCLGWGLQKSDADDVAQNVLLAMSRQMKEFKYDLACGSALGGSSLGNKLAPSFWLLDAVDHHAGSQIPSNQTQ